MWSARSCTGAARCWAVVEARPGGPGGAAVPGPGVSGFDGSGAALGCRVELHQHRRFDPDPDQAIGKQGRRGRHLAAPREGRGRGDHPHERRPRTPPEVAVTLIKASLRSATPLRCPRSAAGRSAAVRRRPRVGSRALVRLRTWTYLRRRDSGRRHHRHAVRRWCRAERPDVRQARESAGDRLDRWESHRPPGRGRRLPSAGLALNGAGGLSRLHHDDSPVIAGLDPVSSALA